MIEVAVVRLSYPLEMTKVAVAELLAQYEMCNTPESIITPGCY
jgi:hypothetical protein